MRLIRFAYCSVLRPRPRIPCTITSSTSCLHLTFRGLSTIQTTKKNTSSQTSIEQEKRDKIDIGILKKLSSYLWPKNDEPNAMQIKSRIGGALLLLLGSKLINIQVPFIFKDIIDTCGTFETSSSTVAGAMAMDPYVAVPLSVVLGYGLARSTSALMQERYVRTSE